MPQLSKRGDGNVTGILPQMPKAIVDAGLLPDEDSIIDLSMAENWLIRNEIIEIKKTVAEDVFKTEHLSFPKGFWGDWRVLEQLANFFNSYFNPAITVTKDHIALAPGAAGCLDAVMYNICDAQDGVLIPTPYWNGYESFCRMRADVVPIPVASSDLTDISSFLSNLDESLQQANRPVKALVLTNPHNPLGRCFTLQQLEECLKWCERNNLHLVSDEVFGPLNFETEDLPKEETFVSVLALDCKKLMCDPERVHVIWSPSKVFAMSGVRLGCTVTQHNKALRNGHALAAFHNVSVLSATLVLSLLSSPTLPALLSINNERHAKSYSILTSWLKKLEIPYLPCNSAPFLMVHIMPDAKSWEDEAMIIKQLQDVNVWVSAGRAQHMPENRKGWARLTFALEPKKIEAALMRMEPVLRKTLVEK